MKCQVCQKREASIAYTHITDSGKKTVLVCSECAPNRETPEPEHVPVKPELLDKVAAAESARTDARAGATITCPGCGLSYEEFRKSGRFGCHACYDAFGGRLERLLKRIHGAGTHRGRARQEQPGPPSTPSPQEDLGALQRELNDAVQAEAYERAAEIRDRIRQLAGSADDAPDRTDAE